MVAPYPTARGGRPEKSGLRGCESLLPCPCCLILLFLLSTTGCARVLGIEERPVGATTQPGDAGDGAAGDASVVEQEASCPRRLPEHHADDPTDGPEIELVFAVHSLDFGPNNRWKEMGFDLDGVDTQPDSGASSCGFTGTTTPPTAWWDNACAMDNAGSGLVWTAALSVKELGENLNNTTAEFQKGTKGILLRIQGYNGMPNDQSVILSVLETTGATAPPLWEGQDEWSVAKQSLVDQKNRVSLYTAKNAYVAAGVVAAEFEQFPIRMGLESSSTIVMPVEQGLVSARLVKDSSSGLHKLVDGRLGGILRPTNLFAIAASTKAGCLDAGAMEFLMSGTCQYRDIRLQTPDDAGSRCNAFAVGVAFEAWEAKLAELLADAPETPPPCPAPDCPP